jgi:GAF domain-containing protein
VSENDVRAAVAAGIVGAGAGLPTLLAAIAEVARQIFGAKASTIMLLDEETDELVFEAVAGHGKELIGMRIPAETGIAGWVAQTGTPLILDDVQEDPRFAKSVAESVGYLPKGLMAAPLQNDERTLGVLEVLDRPERSRFSLQEMELLGLFANQAAIAVELLLRARRAERLLEHGEDSLAIVARLATTLEKLEGNRREAALRLLEALTDTLGNMPGAA